MQLLLFSFLNFLLVNSCAALVFFRMQRIDRAFADDDANSFEFNSLLNPNDKRKKPGLSGCQKCGIASCSCCLFCCFLCIGLIAGIYFALFFAISPMEEELYWDWSKINLEGITFPKNFSFGTATAAHQVEGYNYNNQWFDFEGKENPATGKCYIAGCERAGKTDDQWHLYKNDIALMQNQLNVNFYRFSIEWSKIEPAKGVYNATAIAHYHDLIDTLLNASITPMVTLHHFTDPLWFYKKGSFALQENIEHFVNFSKFAFAEYSSKVQYWCTINEPNVYSLMGYQQGVFPPAKQNGTMAGIVLRNLGEAHVAVYRALKAMQNGAQSQIGIVLNLLPYEPYSRWSPLDCYMSNALNNIYNYALINFFSTGVYKFYIPLQTDIEHTNMNAIGTNDFVGLNQYTHDFVKFQLNAQMPVAFVKRGEQQYTDMGWMIYPEGIYRSIRMISKIGVPIYITENGIADAEDKYRSIFIKKYLYAVNKAIADGFSVKGYIFWSFMDNFEWAEAFRPRFGLYNVNYTSFERKLYEGSKSFIDIVRRSRGV